MTPHLSTKNHIMIDVEALGPAPNGVITSIGAVQFCPLTGEIFDTFKVNIGIQSSLNKGLVVDGKTLLFWFNQPEEARNAMLLSPEPIEDALRKFHNWVVMGPGYGGVSKLWWWANGGNYDFSILEGSMLACSRNVPWLRNSLMDMRVLKKIEDYTAPDSYFNSGNHDAVEDCKRQVLMLKEILEKRNQ